MWLSKEGGGRDSRVADLGRRWECSCVEGGGRSSLWPSKEGGGKSSNRVWKVNVQVWKEVGCSQVNDVIVRTKGRKYWE